MDIPPPGSIDDIFKRLGGPAAVARLLGFPYASAATEMKRRHSIPVKHWPALIARARELDIELDEAKLMAVHTGAPERIA